MPDFPLDEIGAYYSEKEPFPWHWSNSLYLEWIREEPEWVLDSEGNLMEDELDEWDHSLVEIIDIARDADEIIVELRGRLKEGC